MNEYLTGILKRAGYDVEPQDRLPGMVGRALPQEVTVPKSLAKQLRKQDEGITPTDLAYRGLAAALGGPVDLATMVMRPFGYATPDKRVVGGSEWIGKQMEDAGLVSTARAPWQELAASMVSPSGAVKGAALGLGKLGALGMTAWHGSPHKFDKFDLSKRGTGEGAQVYGDGAYLAEAKGVGEGYAKNVKDNMAVQRINEELSDLAKTMSADAIPGSYRKYRTDIGREAAKRYDELLDARDRVLTAPGHLYKTDIPDEAVARMLDWDKPLSEQDAIRKVVYGDRVDPFGNPMPASSYGNLSGEEAYLQLAERLGGREAASKALLDAGIPGIRYLDQGSRGAGDGTSNFVAFDPDMIRILERNGIETTAKPWLPGEYKMPGAAEKAVDLSYRGSHTAPGPDFGAPLHDLTGGGQMYPADVYSTKAVQYYGTGYPAADKEAFAIARSVKGNPDATVTMYRAVPKDASIKAINKGDWVTLSKEYAKNHGESVLGSDYKIIEQKVKAKDLWTNADSIHEFGYWPASGTDSLTGMFRGSK